MPARWGQKRVELPWCRRPRGLPSVASSGKRSPGSEGLLEHLQTGQDVQLVSLGLTRTGLAPAFRGRPGDPPPALRPAGSSLAAADRRGRGYRQGSRIPLARGTLPSTESSQQPRQAGKVSTISALGLSDRTWGPPAQISHPGQVGGATAPVSWLQPLLSPVTREERGPTCEQHFKQPLSNVTGSAEWG